MADREESSPPSVSLPRDRAGASADAVLGWEREAGDAALSRRGEGSKIVVVV